MQRPIYLCATSLFSMTSASFFLATALLASVDAGPIVPVKWVFAAKDLPNGQVRLDLTATIDQGWHVYATQLPSDQGPLPTAVTFAPSDAYYTVDGVKEPEPEKAEDPNFGMVLHFHTASTVFSQTIARKSAAGFTVSGEVEYMACNDQMCLPPVKIPFSIDVPALSK